MKKPCKWKTTTGAVLAFIGIVLTAATQECPVPEWVPWIKWLSSILAASGVALGMVGIASRSEKAAKGQV